MTRLRAGARIEPGGVASEGGSGGGSQGVEIYTLGGVHLFSRGEDLTESLGGRRLALLVYLFHEQRPLSPFEIIELLGRGGDEEKELEGLSRAVGWLKENLDGVNIKMTSDTIEAVRGVWLDSREVDRAIDGRDPACVAELYQGDFLEGFESGSAEFDEWAAKERARIRRAWTNAILSEAERAESAGRWEQAIAWWSILVSRLPTRGEAVAGLIRSYAMAQDDSSASLAYGEYLARLQQNGKGKPADAVLEVVNEYSVQKVDVGGYVVEEEYHVEPEPEAEPGYDIAPEQAAEPGYDIEADQAVESGYEIELEGTPDSGYEMELDTAAEAGYEIEADPVPDAEDEIVLEEPSIDLEPTSEGLELDIESESKAGESLEGLQLGSQLPDAAEGPDEVVEPEPEPSLEPDPEPSAPGPIEGLEGNALADDDLLQPDAEPEILAEPDAVAEPEAPAEPEPAIEPELLGDPEPLPEPHQPKPDTPLEPEGSAEPEFASELQFDTPVDFARPTEPEPAEPEPSFEPAASEPANEWEEIVDFATPDEEEIVIGHGFGHTGEDEAGEAAAVEEDFIDPSSVGDVEERETRGWGAGGLRSGYVATPQPRESSGSSALAGLQKVGEAAGSVVGVVGGALGGATRALGALGGLVGKLRPRRVPSVSAPRLGIGSALRRFWYVPVALVAIAAAVWAAPIVTSKLAALKGDSSDGSGPSVPSVSLPRVTVPKVTVKTPSFVTTSVSKIGEMFSGPILEEPGASIIVADVIGRDGNPHRALTAALQADLHQATFFTAQERERLLLTSARRSDWALSESEALRLALTRGDTLVLAAAVLEAGEEGDTVKIRILDPQGGEIHSAATVVGSDEQLLPALHATASTVRRKLGEPGDDVEASGSPVRVLSPSLEAIDAYDRARAALFNGRYVEAASAGEEAVRIDPDFATAHLLLAEAYALRGRRTQARRALETAWDHRERLSERDKLRVAADRLAFDGKHSDAVFAYDRVFSNYRDDTRALKSQALVERMVGSRGSGLGNLRVAYSISPIDWPPLDRLARYLAYDGPPLPDVDSLAAAVRQ